MADLLETQKSHDTVLLTLISIYIDLVCVPAEFSSEVEILRGAYKKKVVKEHVIKREL